MCDKQSVKEPKSLEIESILQQHVDKIEKRISEIIENEKYKNYKELIDSRIELIKETHKDKFSDNKWFFNILLTFLAILLALFTTFITLGMDNIVEKHAKEWGSKYFKEYFEKEYNSILEKKEKEYNSILEKKEKEYNSILEKKEKKEKEFNEMMPGLLLSFGQSSYELEEYKDSIKYGEKALTFATDKTTKIDVYGLLGYVYNSPGIFQDDKKALAQFKKIIELDKKNFSAYINIGTMYAGMNEYSHAITNFKKAININSSSPDPYYNLAMCYSSLSHHKKEAKENLEKAVEKGYAVAEVDRSDFDPSFRSVVDDIVSSPK